MFATFKARLNRLGLAALVALPLGLAQMVPARADCYYNGYFYDTVSNAPASGVSFTSTVQYTLGYSCSGTPTSINISWWQDKLSFTGGGYHETNEAGVCNPFDPSTWWCNGVWNDFNHTYSCSGRCSITRNVYPNFWMGYTQGAGVWTHWNGCSSVPGGDGAHCDELHQFNNHRLYVRWWFG